ncbi:MAG: nucleotidyl transferase AbiEii/AbiGii toxin family protein [Candidatus Beckwithbacteria bacterium]
MNRQLFTKTLPANTAKLIDIFQSKKPKFLNHFYLSGGTALSLQIDHRESEDLDFFSQKSFNSDLLQQALLKFGNLDQVQLDDNTVNVFLNGVKLQFLGYPYKLIKPTINFQSIKLSSIEDIACTKLQTISMRGSKKDFIDLYFLLNQYPLNNLFQLMKKKYPKIQYSQPHIMKSLVYFDDAEQQPMPRMHQEVTWNEVKNKMISAVKTIKFK